VRCTTGFEKVKPKCCFVDRVADRQQTMVTQQNGLVSSEGEGKPIRLFGVVYNTRVFVKERMIAIKGARVLCHGFDGSPSSGPGLTIRRVGVSDRIYVWASPVDRRVDGKCRAIQLPISDQHSSVDIHQHQVRRANTPPVRSEGVDPKAIRVFGVSHGDVSRNPVVIPEPSKDAVSRCQSGLAMRTLVRNAAEYRFLQWD
jgi:hypothetical protein